MSILLLIDGYNVIGPVAPPARGKSQHWLHDARQLLLNRLTQHLDAAIRCRTCVVFDARNPPAGVGDRMTVAEMDVRFAIDHDEADDLIEELIAKHPAPKTLTVVSSDHRLHAAAKRRKATPIDSDSWMDELLDGHVRLIKFPSAKNRRPKQAEQATASPTPESNAEDEAGDWMNDDELKRWMERYGGD